MRVLAARLGADVRFIDFSAFNRSHPNEIEDGPEMAMPSVPPAFDERGRLIARPNPMKAPLRRVFFGLGLDRIRRATQRRRAALQPPSPRRKTLCAILTRPA
jgi:hypothetical protein